MVLCTMLLVFVLIDGIKRPEFTLAPLPFWGTCCWNTGVLVLAWLIETPVCCGCCWSGILLFMKFVPLWPLPAAFIPVPPPFVVLVLGTNDVMLLCCDSSGAQHTLNTTFMLWVLHRPPIRRCRSSLDDVAENGKKTKYELECLFLNRVKYFFLKYKLRMNCTPITTGQEVCVSCAYLDFIVCLFYSHPNNKL